MGAKATPKEQGDRARTISRSARGIGDRAVTPRDHKAAGEIHLRAAEMNEKAAAAYGPDAKGRDSGGTYSLANDHKQAAAQHREAAAQHAEKSGGEWDDSKHPRDENGKFA